MIRVRSAAVVLATLLATVPPTAVLAQGGATATPVHPFVGAWIVDTNTADDSDPHTQLTVHPDGTLLQADQANVGIGVWEPTGDGSAALTMTAGSDSPDGNPSTVIVRAVIAMDPAGDTWTGEASVEYVAADGSTSGQSGPIPASATRMIVEPMAPSATPAS
jgi:hypothetical protein